MAVSPVDEHFPDDPGFSGKYIVQALRELSERDRPHFSACPMKSMKCARANATCGAFGGLSSSDGLESGRSAMEANRHGMGAACPCTPGYSGFDGQSLNRLGRAQQERLPDL
jgi:hypothetical protein